MTTRYIDGHGTTLSDEMCKKKGGMEGTIIVRLEKMKEDSRYIGGNFNWEDGNWESHRY